MIDYYNQIKNSPLFYGIQEDELKEMLLCFKARIKKYENEDFVIRQGDLIKNIYFILKGNVNIEKDTYWGRRIIVTQLGVNDNIALAFVASKNIESSIDAVAVGILFGYGVGLLEQEPTQTRNRPQTGSYV